MAFLAVFVVKVALGLVAFAIKPWLGVLFLIASAVYVRRVIQETDTAPQEEEIEPLKIRPSATEPSLAWAGLQALLALIVIGFALTPLLPCLKPLEQHCTGLLIW